MRKDIIFLLVTVFCCFTLFGCQEKIYYNSDQNKIKRGYLIENDTANKSIAVYRYRRYKKCGEQMVMNLKNERIVSVYSVRNGKIHGWLTFYYPDGTKRKIAKFRNGKKIIQAYYVSF